MPDVPGYPECYAGRTTVRPYGNLACMVPPMGTLAHMYGFTRWKPGTRSVEAELARPDATTQIIMQTCTGHSPHPAAPSSGDS